MKKLIMSVLAFAITCGLSAQSEQMMREFRLTVQKRDYSNTYLKHIPHALETKGDAKQTGQGMPNEPFWFPGEWEEVQAIVITPYYTYNSTESQYQGYNYMASPAVPGWADIYRYGSYGWEATGATTHYTAEIDVSSDFGQVAFYLMDAIQQGGAQAWVRVEDFADTTIVLQHLASKGLRSNNIRFLEAPGNSFWYRDCGPICFYYGEGDTVGMLDFVYCPGRALDDSLPVYIERQFGLPNYNTMIEWEGGNCLVDGAGMVATSNHIYSANRDTEGQLIWDGVDPSTITYSHKTSLSNTQVRDSLQALIGTRATYILPAFKYDGGTCHIDLYADMIDENQFIFSQMPETYSSWQDYKTGRKNMDSLCSYQSYFGANYRCNFIPFPSNDNGGNFSSQSQYNNRYTRTYSNHTFVNNLIIQPCFSPVGADGMPTAAWDRANIEEIKKAYPGYTIYCVDVREFDGSGGAIHCITKQIPAEHPIRILHQALHGNTGNAYTTSGAPVMARISNVDGIDSVALYYRFEGGQWHHVLMTPDAVGQYAAVIPTAGQQHGEYTMVEYYISATSLAGKTITKPMTAANGGFFTFYLGENPNVGIRTVEAEEAFGQFYPNPAIEMAQMHIELGDGDSYRVAIIDAAGRTVHTSALQASGSILYTINTDKLASGFYSVVFQSDSERVVRKLIVK